MARNIDKKMILFAKYMDIWGVFRNNETGKWIHSAFENEITDKKLLADFKKFTKEKNVNNFICHY